MNSGRLRSFYTSLPSGPLIWSALGLISLIGITFGLGELSKLPAEETWRANMAHQRAIVDAKTGMVSGLESKEEVAFDVGNAETVAPPDMGAAPETPPDHHEPVLDQGLPRLRNAPLTPDIPAVPRSADSLVSAPAPEAVKKIGEMILPRKTDKGLTPARLYAHGFTRKEGEHLLAIIITDVGFSQDAFASLLTLPKEVSIAMSPYATGTNAQIESLRNAGHEAWVMLPTMTDRYPQEDPGPLGLLSSQPADVALGRVHSVLAASIGAVGVVLPEQESITNTETVWKVVFTEIEGRGLLTLSTRNDRSLDQLVVDKKKQESIRRAAMILDSTPASAFIRSKLSTLTNQLDDAQDIIVVASARPQTLSILHDWLKTQSGFTLAPLSAIYRGVEAPPPQVEKKSSGH